MTAVRYGDLTDEERALICNGCGPKGAVLDAPDWLFEASCDHHDFNYWLGHTEDDRRRADWQFYEAMLRDAHRKASFWNEWWYRLMAWTYYKAVRAFGKSAFYYGPHERTREDLNRELAGLATEGDE